MEDDSAGWIRVMHAWKTGLDSSMNSIRLIHIEKHARFHLRVSACVVIVIGDNLGKRLGYGLRDISGD